MMIIHCYCPAVEAVEAQGVLRRKMVELADRGNRGDQEELEERRSIYLPAKLPLTDESSSTEKARATKLKPMTLPRAAEEEVRVVR
mmetsp:Transcript_9845/g.21328  ORF Transcript_9845/g.21328 Transcript_9845/m.21328 type:complete len:86 (+) Transcript_9845:1188-1445(+)